MTILVLFSWFLFTVTVVVTWLHQPSRMMVEAYAVGMNQRLEQYSTQATTATTLLARKKKPSMAEKRAARSKRRSNRPDVSLLPKSNVAAALTNRQHPSSSATGMTVNESVTQKIIQERKTATAKEQFTEATKAQALVQAQKESVATLTAVKQAVDQLPAHDVQEALESTGFWYGDNFLLSNNNNDLLSKLQKEGQDLLPSMTKQTEELVSGEYTVAIQGGPEQYQICPRSIEWVVSVTKHLPVLLAADKDNNFDNSGLQLSTTNCMAAMRTFDRKALEASLELVVASTNDGSPEYTRATEVETIIDKADDSSGTFETLVTDPNTDLRRLSLCYYLVPAEWNEEDGGGLSFLSDEGQVTNVAAQRDRLVIWKSDQTRVRKNPWKGQNDYPLGSCIELDLVRTQNP